MDRGYELIRKIAGGGMGEVFVARLTGVGNFEKRVALKFLLPHLSDSSELVRRFHEEARLAARMHHPNIVEIFDVGEADGRPFIAMQLVDGVTLGRLQRDVMKSGAKMPLSIVRLIGTGLCEALGYAHGLADGQGKPLMVVHRDVTPGNILVSRNGAVLLTDFGIARIHDGSMTEPGLVRGKAAYVAPEQVTRASRLDARADVYSAALTLYEALTGVHPFKREHFSESLTAVVEGKIAPIASLRSDVSPALAAALHKALSKRPEERFPNARAFREALVDGPVATAPELAEFVRAHCGEALVEDAGEPVAEGTRSVITVTPTQLELPAPIVALPPEGESSSRGRLLGFGALVGLAILGVISWGVLASHKPAEVTVEPEVTLPGPKPKPTPPEAVVQPEAPKPPEIAVVKADVVEPEPVVKKRPLQPKNAPPPVAPAAVKVGYLSADASPWAEVLMGGKLLDRTPFAKFPLPAGKHVLVFRGPGGETKKRNVIVSEGAVTAVRVEF
ncbi:MAG: serine/threonine-protein kinase [Archangium sp.]